MSTALRRLVLLLVASAVVGGVLAAVRSRQQPAVSGPPEWPPFEPKLVTEPAEAPVATKTTTADHVRWVGASDDGSAPADHPVKVNTSSGIFHVPGGRFYERTVAERHYASAEEAVADGYRQSKT